MWCMLNKCHIHKKIAIEINIFINSKEKQELIYNMTTFMATLIWYRYILNILFLTYIKVTI